MYEDTVQVPDKIDDDTFNSCLIAPHSAVLLWHFMQPQQALRACVQSKQ
jgi:hypothetical protein